ncbi:MAG: DUF932 domain-containing protein [Verrucomicrobiaceae bacterium]|nr:DUF932 domain-containing protein [Verrucomicrobiaceae bacterium]
MYRAQKFPPVCRHAAAPAKNAAAFTNISSTSRHDTNALRQATHNKILLLNSHNSTSSYRLTASVFRCACENSLITAQNLL